MTSIQPNSATELHLVLDPVVTRGATGAAGGAPTERLTATAAADDLKIPEMFRSARK